MFTKGGGVLAQFVAIMALVPPLGVTAVLVMCRWFFLSFFSFATGPKRAASIFFTWNAVSLCRLPWPSSDRNPVKIQTASVGKIGYALRDRLSYADRVWRTLKMSGDRL